jgi:hypothetical protein
MFLISPGPSGRTWTKGGSLRRDVGAGESVVCRSPETILQLEPRQGGARERGVEAECEDRRQRAEDHAPRGRGDDPPLINIRNRS